MAVLNNASVKIWKNAQFLTPANNYYIEDIESYLGTPSVTFNYFQYLEFKPIVKIIIQLDQTNIQFGTDQNYNYCKIERHGYVIGEGGVVEDFAYFFIKSMNWKSTKAIELELEMDVLNTFKWNQDYEVSDKTLIKREHKNRWQSGTYPGGYAPVVDRYSEGIQPPLYKTEESTLFAVNEGDFELDYNNYYLIYRSHTTSENSPLDIFLCSDSPLQVDQSSTGWSGVIDPKRDLGSKYSYVIYGNDSDGIDNNIGARIYIEQGNEWVEVVFTSSTAVLIINNIVRVGTIDGSGFHQSAAYSPVGLFKNNFRTIICEGLYRVRVDTRKHVKYDYFSTFTPSYVSGLGYVDYIHSESGGEPVFIGTINDIDRTDAKLLKIIKLPYSPIPLNISGETIILPHGWTTVDYDGSVKLISYRNPSALEAFESSFNLEPDPEYSNYGSPYNMFMQRMISTFGSVVVKDKKYESKLMHSDYLNQRFVYDSFYYDFKGEDMDFIDGSMSLFLKYCVSSNLSSKFMFELQYKPLYDNQNYTGIISVDRNNELPIYNSAYMNYIRNGYNYDVKSKNRQLATNIITSIASTAGAVASFMSTPVTGPMGVAGGIGLATASASSYVNLASNAVQNEWNIQQKLKNAELQGLSVIGADDIDLLSVYTAGNKAKLIKFEVTPKMKDILYDLFYYTGYISNEYKVPSTLSRKWFNFIQCDLICNKWNNIPVDIQEVIRKKFAEGVTFFHCNQINAIKTWDLAQEYENWETFSAVKIKRIDTPTTLIPEDYHYYEYVIKPDLFQIYNIARLTQTGGLTWRKRSKADLHVIETISGLDTITFKGNLSEPAMDVRVGSTISKEVTFKDYRDADYYWTIRFNNYAGAGYNQSLAYEAIMGYITDYFEEE